jgi:glycosyltransferase involved in cell wall biosynthesis
VPARALVDGSSYLSLVPGARTFDDWLSRKPAPLRLAARRWGVARGVLLFAASVRHDAVAVIRTGPGWRSLLALRALLGRRRKLVVLQFIVHPPRERGLARRADLAWDRLDRIAIRRAMRAGQALTTWERSEYARRYGLPAERFAYVPWPRRRRPAGELPAPPAEPLVVSSGRAAPDWPTLFAAARGAAWPLAVVCSQEDRADVERLNADGRATVLSEIPPAEHEGLLRRASVLAIVMREMAISQGHVRLMDAADSGVAVVVTAARGVADYAVDGETALLVPPGDAPALRAAVDRLVADPALRDRIRRGADERSLTWTAEDYLAALAALITGGSHVPFPHGHDP